MILNTTWLWAAALVSAMSWGIHTFVGGRQIVPALFGSDLKKMPKYVLFFVWHIATITIAAIAIGYALAALYPSAWVLGVQSTIVSGLISILILGVAIWQRMGLKDMPQWTIFLVMALCGAGAMYF